MTFKEHEIVIIEALTGHLFSQKFLASLYKQSKTVDFYYSECGYFLTVSHPKLPIERIVFSKPFIEGNANEIDSGFIIFIENRELTLECFSQGEAQVTEGYRDLPISIEITP